jgi:hypothetical protein
MKSLKIIKIIAALGVFLMITAGLAAQNDSIPVYDTIFIKKNTTLSFNDSSYVFQNDTTLIISRKIVDQNPELKTLLFYSKLEEQSQKSFVMREIYKAVFAPRRSISDNDTLTLQNAEAPFVDYQGKVIRNIRYKVLGAFGTSVADTSLVYSNRFFDWINKTYPPTRKKIIQNSLLFSAGDSLSASDLSNSERLLRQLRSLNDARIYVDEMAAGSDSVDIVVVVKDVYPFGASVNAIGIDRYELDIFSVNFLGLGHLLSNTVIFAPTASPWLEYNKFRYYIPNIAGKFIDVDITAENNVGGSLLRFNAKKDFLPAVADWGGHAKVERHEYFISRNYDFPPDFSVDSSERVPIGYHGMDYFLGYNMPVSNEMVLNNPDFFSVGAAVETKNYFTRPKTRPDTNIRYQQRTDMLFSVSFFRNNYYRTRFVNDFGKTEDIPYGMRLSLTAGYEFGEFFDRSYMGASASAGNFLAGSGYFFFLAEAGSFIHNRQWEQGLFTLRLRYFSDLWQFKENYNYRLFSQISYTAGLNRYENEKMFLLNQYKSRNYDLYKFDGNQQMNLNVGITTFTPWYFYGFRFAVDVFVDATLIGSAEKSIFDNQLYSGIGIGFKVKNEDLAFGTFQFRFMFFPTIQDGQSHLGFMTGNHLLTNFDDFISDRLRLIPYDYYYAF